MKKFVSVLLAVIIALSMSVVAFAETENYYPDDAEKFYCKYCHASFDKYEQIEAHYRTGCLEQYKKCPYCDAVVQKDSLEKHQKECPKGAGSCKYCGESYATEDDFDKHLENECWLVGLVGSKDVADVIIKIVDFLKGVDWEGLFNKVSDVVSGIDLGGIIDTIKPVFEKIIGFIGEKVELPAL